MDLDRIKRRDNPGLGVALSLMKPAITHCILIWKDPDVMVKITADVQKGRAGG